MSKKKPSKAFEVVKFKTSDIRIKCPEHGDAKIQPAYDPALKAMTGISCAECPPFLPPKK